jgi:hypothetical protein
MSGEFMALHRKEPLPEVVSKQLDIPVEVAALPPPPSQAPQPEHLRMEEAPRFSPQDTLGYQEFLEEHGYVVIRGVMDAAEVATATDLFWQFLGQYGMKQDDPDSWKDENFGKIGSIGSGIVARGGFGQSEFQWFCRTRTSVGQVFASVYDSPDLLTSLDGGNIFRPWQVRNK